MKKLWISLALTGCCLASEAQSKQILYYLQQIAALEIYSEALQKGYGLVKGGLDVVRDLKQGDFDVHNGYFASLKGVNASISHDGKVKSANALYADLLQACNAAGNILEHLPAAQQDYVGRVIAALRTMAKHRKDQYDLLATSGNYQLTDDERLQHIDAVLAELTNQYQFLKHFHHQLQLLILQRQKESSDRKAIGNLYQP